ncbi:MAG: Crp/Fnr family transcriptional regulator [Myxococcota bacterium]
MAEDAGAILRRAPIFAGLDDGQIETLARLTVRRRYAARDIVIEKGDEALYLFVIVSGRLKAITPAASGRHATFNVMGAGELFGEVALLDEQPRSATITALEACEVLTIGRAEFLHFLERSPRAALALLRVLAGRLRRLSEKVADTANLEVGGRLAKQLLRLAERYGKRELDGVRIDLKLSQQELGDMVGATRESVNKQLREWTDAGIVHRRGGHLVLCAPETLAAAADP